MHHHCGNNKPAGRYKETPQQGGEKDNNRKRVPTAYKSDNPWDSASWAPTTAPTRNLIHLMPTTAPTTSKKVEVKEEEEEEEEEGATPLEDEEGTPQMHQIFQLWEAAKRGNPNMARLEDKQIKAGERSKQEMILAKQDAKTIRFKQDQILVEEREEEECMERESTLFEEFRAAENSHFKGKSYAGI